MTILRPGAPRLGSAIFGILVLFGTFATPAVRAEDSPPPPPASQAPEDDTADDGKGFMGLGLFGTGRDKDEETGSVRAGVAVNRYLWRASLDTISFMPMAAVDPFGGVIITDWYANPNVPNERFKMTVYVLDPVLRADGVKVSVFRQLKKGSDWIDAPTNPATAAQLENAILTRARQLKVETSK